MTKVHGKRYAYKFDFQGLAAATQPAASDPAYKYQSDLFMTPYHHGTKITSFMSPHHGMASSSGEYFYCSLKYRYFHTRTIPNNSLDIMLVLMSVKNQDKSQGHNN